MKVRIGKGLDDVAFGMSRQQVEDLFGEPAQRATDRYHDDLTDSTEAFYYWDRGVSCHFHADADWRLTTIEITAPEAEIRSRRLIGHTLDALLQFVAAEGVTWSEQLDNETRELQRVEVDSWGLTFWMEQGAVSAIQWGVLFDDGDNEIWP